MNLIELAKKWGYWDGNTAEFNDVGLEAFAAAIRADERQEIDKELGPLCRVGSVSEYVQGRWDFAEELQSILKERGQK